jgi:mRNA interferase MazF
MRQGEIWQLRLDPATGREQAGTSPAVIVSGNLMNAYLDVVMICPLTTKVKGYKGNVVLKPSGTNKLKAPSEVLNFHLRSVSNERLYRKIGAIEDHELAKTLDGINDLLHY